MMLLQYISASELCSQLLRSYLKYVWGTHTYEPYLYLVLPSEHAMHLQTQTTCD